MKKFIFIILTVLLCFTAYSKETSNFIEGVSTVYGDTKAVVDTVYHDAKGVIGTVYEDTKTFAKDIYPDVKSAVISIAKGIGIAAEHVYEVLVKQFVVKGAKELLLFIIALSILLWGLISTSKYIKNNTEVNWKIIPRVIIVSIGFFMMMWINYNDMLMGLINPEYGAINYILEYSRGIIK